MEKDIFIQQLLERITKLEQEVILLRTENAELKKRLSKNSHNSSKPPSSDGLSKPPKNPPASLREKGKNKSGGQLGHKGETLQRCETPDTIMTHRLLFCSSCQASLTMVEPIGMSKRQVIDIPQPKVEVTDHHAEIKVCPCCRVSRQPFRRALMRPYNMVIG